MNIKPIVLLIGLLTGCSLIASAQKKDTTALKQVDVKGATAPLPKKLSDSILVGTVTGTLKDSLHNYVLRSATVTIYRAADNELVGFQLTNNYGKFTFKQVPVGIPLKIIGSHVSYKDSEKKFLIPKNTKTIELGTVTIDRTDRVLKEVAIKASVPPMQMRGDTLEFNAAAFKLDTNAVIDDLLRKLTGVTIWADGKITVNGRPISRLLVDGKEFFGGAKIALQNIPKNSVQKIQVYQVDKEKDPAYAQSEVNVVLKKDKKKGTFGKIGVGGGTSRHYQADGMMAYFSPQTQASVVGAFNDINKTASSVSSMMEFNSFKGGSNINDDNHSDFRRDGRNIFRGGGFTMSHDLNQETDTRKRSNRQNMLRGELFYNNSSNTIISNSNTLTSLGTAGNLNQTSSNTSDNTNWGLRSNGSYSKSYLHGSLYASYNFSSRGANSKGEQMSNSFNDDTQRQTENRSTNNNSNDGRNFSLSLRGNTNRYFEPKTNRYKSANLSFAYTFGADDSNSDTRRLTSFTSNVASENRNFDRTYANRSNSTQHTLNTNLGQLLDLLIHRNRIRWDISVGNTLNVSNRAERNDVNDLITGTVGQYQPNTGLTNNSTLTTVNERPSITFSRSFSKSFENRFYKSLSFYINAQAEAFSQRNTALQSVQNIQRSYFNFVPSATVRHSNDQYGNYRAEYSLNYSTSVNYPSIFQIAPLADNSDLNSIPLVNLKLKPTYRHGLNFSYDYNSQVPKNDFNAELRLSAAQIERNITDSVFYDALNRTVRKYVNGKTNRNFRYEGNLNRTIKIKNHQFEGSFESGAGYDLFNSFVNGQDYDTRQASWNTAARVIYYLSSTWSGGVGEYYSGNKTFQGDLSQLTSYTWTTNFGFAFAFPGSFFCNTKVNFNNTKSSAQADNIYYTIWNADFGYRFFKNASGEIKLSALDILHQNRGLQNYVSNNTITQRTSNVLTQYFMLTFAYYPRGFGPRK
ncbi:outer membrane beta-barrel protein [Mucilaginibacter myungsuensis]|uniref:Outer membrane beta-barrel protein n=1 Tax=Mucilaginibacter myungsuensis TaxID=649104 RepID=A0A929PUF1_9SPHI|nr:outer membrane beta-barrel protein [Mucilaginibacter myungsuensis]MBE9660693.1 outer membrane beta-barrel protein [Mucilaginibacter myungsuensis]MDN3600738.1 outer membrane beta-barrel protein [Mucilaginibacter myungsuensis]